MRFIKLNKITADRARDRYSETDEPGENAEPQIETTPVSINVETIRCFYPRKNNAVGTRITFTDGGGFAVSETCEAVETTLAEVGFGDPAPASARRRQAN